MEHDIETRARTMAQHINRVAVQSDEFEAQALAADRMVRALNGAGQIEEANRFGTAELARLHLALVRLGVEFEGRPQALLGMSRQPDETLVAFLGRVGERLAELGRQFGGLADLPERSQ